MGIIYFSIAFANIFLGIAILLFSWGWISKKIDLDFSKNKSVLFFVLALPFLLTLFSVFNSEDISSGMRFIRLRIPILAISFMLTFIKISNKNIKVGLSMFVGASLIAGIITLIKALSFIDEGILFQSDFASFITPIQHPYFGIYLIIAIISLLEFDITTNKVIKYGSAFLLVLGVVISTSRLAYLLLFFIIIFYSFQLFSKKKAILVGVLLGITSFLLINSNQSILSKFQTSFNYENSPRLKLWNNALKVVNQSDHKFLGIGIGDYYEIKADPYFYKEVDNGIYGYDPHSQFFDFFITNGYLGVMILIGYFIIIVGKVSKQNKYAKLVFIVILLFSLTESILNRQYGVQLYSIFIPLIMRTNFKRKT